MIDRILNNVNNIFNVLAVGAACFAAFLFVDSLVFDMDLENPIVFIVGVIAVVVLGWLFLEIRK